MAYRTAARDPGASRLTPRDLLLLRFVALSGPVSAAQAAIMVQMSQQMVRRRLRVLRDHRCVLVHADHASAPNYYTAGTIGLRELERAFGFSESRPVSPPKKHANLRHHLVGVDLEVALTVAFQKAPNAGLVRYASERALRKDAPGSALIPDACALAYFPALEAGVALEVDLATESPSVLASKAERYAALHDAGRPLFGATSWTIGVVVPSIRRRNVAMRAMWQAAPIPGLFRFAVLDDLSADNILRDVWLGIELDAAGASAKTARMPLFPVPTDRNDGEYGSRGRKRTSNNPSEVGAAQAFKEVG